MKNEEMKVIGKWIADAIRERESESALEGIGKKVKGLTASFPLYPRRLSESSTRATQAAT